LDLRNKLEQVSLDGTEVSQTGLDAFRSASTGARRQASSHITFGSAKVSKTALQVGRRQDSASLSHRSRHLRSGLWPCGGRKLLDAGELVAHGHGSGLHGLLGGEVQDAAGRHVHPTRCEHRGRSRQPFAERLKERFAVVKLLTSGLLSRQLTHGSRASLDAHSTERPTSEVELVGGCLGSGLSRLSQCRGGHGTATGG